MRQKKPIKKTIRFKQILKGLAVVCFFVFIIFSSFKMVAYLKDSYFFRVKEVNVKGTHFLLKEDITKTLNVKPGMSIFEIDIDRLKERLKKEPWIREARVERRFPNTLNINIQERVPFAVLLSKDRYLLDDSGFVIKRVDGEKRVNPLIKGAENVDVEIGSRVSKDEIHTGLEILKSLKSAGLYDLKDISMIDVSQRERASVKTQNMDIRLNTDNFKREISRLKTVSKLLKRDKRRIAYVDLSFKKKIIVKYF